MLYLKNVSKTFNPGSVDEKKVFCDLSLHVNKGDFVTIIGSNGAGKSTLFNVICGDFLADAGSISLAGEDITFKAQHERASKIGRLYQDPVKGTAPGMTIEENLALAAGSGGWLSRLSKTDRNRFKEELKKLDMGLENRLSHTVGLLSGGQRQALTLLMATINPPRILLLDEHTAALDPGTAEKVLNITKEVIEESKITALMITHNMRDAINLGNRLIMMNEGKIILDIMGEDKSKLTVDDLVRRFKESSGKEFANDEALLSKED